MLDYLYENMIYLYIYFTNNTDKWVLPTIMLSYGYI